jgi:hypothetical protein
MENKGKTQAKKSNVISIESAQKKSEPAIDQKLIEKTKQDFENFANEINKKSYVVAGGKKTGQAILNFLENEAEWSAHEALGIEKAYEDLETAMKTNKELMLPTLCIKAISYFTGKVKGVGLQTAKKYKQELFTPLNDAMGRISNDEKHLEELKHRWAAAVQGVETDSTQENL